MESQITVERKEQVASSHSLLVVERSASMRQVLGKYLTAQGFEPILIDDYAQTLAHLDARFQARCNRLDAVLFGWPTVMEPAADACLQALATGDHADLPIVVLSTDMRAETRAWASNRPNSALLGWKDYQRTDSALIDLLRSPVELASPALAKCRPLSLLLVDDNETSRVATSSLWSDHGYTVRTATHAAGAIDMARTEAVDIVLIDFQWNAQRGDALCRQLVNDAGCQAIAVVMLLEHPVGHQIARCLQAGAVECFYRSESNRLQLARIDALGRLMNRCESRSAARSGEAAAHAVGSQTQLATRAEAPEPGDADTAIAPESVASGRDKPERAESDGAKSERAESDQAETFTATRPELAAIAGRAGWNASAVPVLDMLENRRSGGGKSGSHYLMMLLETREDLAGLAVSSLGCQVSSIARVAPCRLLLLIDSPVGTAGYQQVRSIMQTVNALGIAHGTGAATSCASVIAPLLNSDKPLAKLLGSLLSGLNVISERETNKALLLDLKRLLPVYPTN